MSFGNFALAIIQLFVELKEENSFKVYFFKFTNGLLEYFKEKN